MRMVKNHRAAVLGGENIPVVAGAVKPIIGGRGQNRLGFAGRQIIALPVGVRSFDRFGAAHGQIVSVVGVVSAGDKQIPPSVSMHHV